MIRHESWNQSRAAIATPLDVAIEDSAFMARHVLLKLCLEAGGLLSVLWPALLELVRFLKPANPAFCRVFAFLGEPDPQESESRDFWSTRRAKEFFMHRNPAAQTSCHVCRFTRGVRWFRQVQEPPSRL